MHKQTNPPVFQSKCIMGHKYTMTPEQVKEAQAFGCAMCPTCHNVATVERVSIGKKVKYDRH